MKPDKPENTLETRTTRKTKKTRKKKQEHIVVHANFFIVFFWPLMPFPCLCPLRFRIDVWIDQGFDRSLRSWKTRVFEVVIGATRQGAT